MRNSFPIRGFYYWFFLIFSCCLLVMLIIGQTGSLISYDYAVKLGLQESIVTIGRFGVAMNKGFALADTIVYIPLVIIAIIGFWYKRRWGIISMASVMGITVYWPIICLFILIFAHGTPDFYFDHYVMYTILLGTISILAIWSLLYLLRIGYSTHK